MLLFVQVSYLNCYNSKYFGMGNCLRVKVLLLIYYQQTCFFQIKEEDMDNESDPADRVKEEPEANGDSDSDIPWAQRISKQNGSAKKRKSKKKESSDEDAEYKPEVSHFRT